jgi:NAD-dependent SIR2 family protein deacetylase
MAPSRLLVSRAIRPLHFHRPLLSYEFGREIPATKEKNCTGHRKINSALPHRSSQTTLYSIVSQSLMSLQATTQDGGFRDNKALSDDEATSEAGGDRERSIVSADDKEEEVVEQSPEVKIETPKTGSDDKGVDEITSAVDKIHLAESQPHAGIVAYTASHVPEAVRKAAQWIQQSKRILVLSGAGVSVAAGLPDFRSPGTGLYDNLQKYNLPYPEAVFELDFYRRNPQPFLLLAKELWPSGSSYLPTLTHSFLALLAQKNRLLRNYTQNIDGLEFLANIPDHLLVECHGHFRSASCVRCGTAADPKEVEETILDSSDVPKCQQKRCSGLVKPDIVFFGEDLPDRFHSLWKRDTNSADLCLILGTSLQVAPVSMLPEMVNCRRILFNRELVGNIGDRDEEDLFHGGDCDESIELVAHTLGWYDELKACHKLTQKTNNKYK